MPSGNEASERVGRYQLLEPIGGGPNGQVWRAKVFGVAGFERQFAIKRFLPELTANSSTAQALSAAARSYGGLEHPRIARMSEFGVAQGQTFTAVELVAGLDVQRLIAEARLGGQWIGAGGALALISQAARAVGYAHGRGLSHLGLSPSNVIVTAEGDVKVTDFGILAATIPAKPVESPRFAQRIGYLAPEQLVGEATSAATDVFVLGVIAYELVTGQRAFFGDSPADIAAKILAGPPADPPLPRPIVRVLARCLARSQFERFPDARAFADALDAALRVAPVPGTRKDVGAQVKATLDRHAAMNEGNLSGVVALNLQAPPTLGPSSALADMDLRGSMPAVPEDDGIATTNFVRPDVEVPGPTPLVGPGGVPKSPTTMPGVQVPPSMPPVPVPGGPPTPQLAQKRPPSTIPAIKPKNPIPSIVPPALRPIGAPPVSSKMTGAIPALRQTQPGTGPMAPRAPSEVDDFGRPRDQLTGPVPGRGAPGRPATNLEISTETGMRPGSESDVNTRPGTDALAESLNRLGSEFGNDDATRPGEYARAESDFSDLAVEPDPNPTADAFARGAKGLQPRPPLQPLAPKRADVADPPTAEHAVLPEVHERGGLAPFARSKNDTEQQVTTNTMPSIEILRDSTSDLPRAASSSTNPPFERDMKTSEMTDDLVQELKRASEEAEDPLVELQLEQHGRGAISVIDPDSDPAVPAAPKPNLRKTPVPANPPTRSSAPSIGSGTLFGVGKAGELRAGDKPELGAREGKPAGARMPSPSPPSLVPSAVPLVHSGAVSAPNLAPPGFPSKPPGADLSGPAATAPGMGAASAGVTAPDLSTFTPPTITFNPPSATQPPPLTSGAAGGLARPGTPVPGTVQSLAPPPPRPERAPQFSLPSQASTTRKRWPMVVGALLVLGGGAGIAAWQMSRAGGEDAPATGSNGSAVKVAAAADAGAVVAVVPGDAATAIATATPDAGAATPDAAVVAVVTPDAGVGSGAGSASVTKQTVAPTGTSDSLQIASTPPGARVFIDGADQGVTPVKLAGSADRHTMALSLAGHELYVAEVDGHGAFQIPMKPVTPSGGPAGIKVIKCKDKDRYYVFVDGKPTGMTCPTERIEVPTGPHVVEVYDLVTENRRKFEINVTDTRLSYRVKID